jgi:LCP family protein required for cell wall assembly
MSEPRSRSRASRASRSSGSSGSSGASGAGLIRHGRLKRRRPAAFIAKIVASFLAVLLVSGASVAALSLWRLQENIVTVDLVGGDENAPAPSIGAYPGGYNFLVVGSDIRSGPGGVGAGTGAELNDVTMLLHVSEDHTRAVAVSIPRDLVVPIPSCPDGEGGEYSSMAAQPINVSLSYGGLACTVLTVEALTGLEIQFAGVITFNGVIEMSTAVGGVDVCVDAPINDPDSGLLIEEAGTVPLEGGQALAFLRSRHGVGDGSDLGRISSQQVYLSSLVRTLKSEETLTNLPRLYALASAATQNMTLSSNLKSLDTLVAVAQSLRNIPLESVVFVQYPGTTEVGGVYEGKVAPVMAKAEQLFELIEADEPFVLTDTTSIGSIADPNAPVVTDPTATPTAGATPGATPGATDETAATATISGLSGQTAADYTCSKAN